MTTRAAALLVGLALASCGPVQSTAYLLDAEVQIQAARTAGAEMAAARAAGAEVHAPYEYTSAKAYLHKAREEVGYSDFEVAVDFAQKASRYANEAKEKAMSASKKDEVPLPPPPPSH